MAPKAAQEAAQKKAAKQKKILIVLALPMLVAVVYAYTTMSKLHSRPDAVSATPGRADDVCGTRLPTAGTTTRPSRPEIVAAPVDSLRSFTALDRKDPFYRPRAERLHRRRPRVERGNEQREQAEGQGSGTAARRRSSRRAADRRGHLAQRREARPRGRSGRSGTPPA